MTFNKCFSFVKLIFFAHFSTLINKREYSTLNMFKLSSFCRYGVHFDCSAFLMNSWLIAGVFNVHLLSVFINGWWLLFLINFVLPKNFKEDLLRTAVLKFSFQVISGLFYVIVTWNWYFDALEHVHHCKSREFRIHLIYLLILI
jgi:hypothetical protein